MKITEVFINHRLVLDYNAPRGVFKCQWGGICYTGLIGPYFFEKTVTGENYAEMLEEVVLPEFQNSPIYDFPRLIW